MKTDLGISNASDRNGKVEVVLDKDLLEKAPCCPHGPTLVFERYIKGSGDPRRFFACSANRDRKLCRFFYWVDEYKGNAMNKYSSTTNLFTIQEKNERLQSVKNQCGADRVFCETCNLLLIKGEEASHEKHELLTGLTDKQLCHPSSLLKPLENSKSNAQYLFDEKTTKFLSNLITKQLKKKRILCIGTPTLHEALRDCSRDGSHECKSLLLDIDYRLVQFYGSGEVCYYNLFNHYFFDDKESVSTYKKFLKKGNPEDFVVVIDPPFGGLVEVIHYTLQRIKEDWKLAREDTTLEMPVLWMFPYFMEPRITSIDASFNMLDYKVGYGNHSSFAQKPNQDSPVRIFTNIAPIECVLPTKEGYRLCADCMRYVAVENKHCKKCKLCPTKFGKTYVHCDECGRCVKASWQHCSACNTCELPGRHTAKFSKGPCHVCGEAGHKRKECPRKLGSNAASKTITKTADQLKFEKAKRKAKFVEEKKKKRKIMTQK